LIIKAKHHDVQKQELLLQHKKNHCIAEMNQCFVLGHHLKTAASGLCWLSAWFCWPLIFDKKNTILILCNLLRQTVTQLFVWSVVHLVIQLVVCPPDAVCHLSIHSHVSAAPLLPFDH